MPIRRVLVANRGEIAVRIIRACEELGLETVLAVSEADRDSLGARLADRVFCIGPGRATESYLNPGALVAAAVGTGCDALHPGYGFLSESPALVEACDEAGVTFVGPTADHIRAMGNKIQARLAAEAAGVPVLPGSQRIASAEDASGIAGEVGYPVMLKAAGGGGGRGMKVVYDPAEIGVVFTTASAEAAAAFGDPTLYLERYLPDARHVEVQVFGDVFGNAVHVGERDCSSQRRHQKVVEESPAPGLSERLREELRSAGVRLAKAIAYRGAGTVEFLVDVAADRFYFLEMNTRIQVEHPVSELVSGIDLVEAQFRVAAGEPLGFEQADVQLRGHAIECRITAESAEQDFLPNAGTITRWQPPDGPNIRLDSHCYEGYRVPIYYDSLLAKLLVYGPTRAEAVLRMQRALERFEVEGVTTTLPFLRYLTASAEFIEGRVSTQLIDERLLDEYRAGLIAGGP